MASTAPQDFGQPYILEDFVAIQHPTTSTSLCAVCHTDAPHKRCSTCKNIHYCSASCQARDWALHKTICKAFVKSESARPGPTSRRAIYFPSDSARPSFVWLEYSEEGTPFDIQKCFPDTPEEDIKTIAFHNRYLPYWIQISYDSNPSGVRSLGKNISVGHAFRGPVVALAYDPEEGLGKPALDVDTTILRPVVEYAELRETYAGPVFVEQPQKSYTKEEWKGFMGGVLDEDVLGTSNMSSRLVAS